MGSPAPRRTYALEVVVVPAVVVVVPAVMMVVPPAMVMVVAPVVMVMPVVVMAMPPVLHGLNRSFGLLGQTDPRRQRSRPRRSELKRNRQDDGAHNCTKTSNHCRLLDHGQMPDH